MKRAVDAGLIKQITLRGVTPDGFCIEGMYQEVDGLPVAATLVTRAGVQKMIKCPERAVDYLRKLGVFEFEVDVRQWDPQQAFNPGLESYRSRERRRRRTMAQQRVLELDRCGAGAGTALPPGLEWLGELNSPAARKLANLVRALSGQAADAVDIKSLAMCWFDVFLADHPDPDAAREVLTGFARAVNFRARNLGWEVSRCVDEEFKYRCKNQHLSTLDIGSYSG